MVTGIERWKEYFNEYKDKYVLIGGAACNLLEEELDMNPRATKDLDLVLVVEALTPLHLISDYVCGILSKLPIMVTETKEKTNSNTNIIVLPILKTRPIRSK